MWVEQHLLKNLYKKTATHNCNLLLKTRMCRLSSLSTSRASPSPSATQRCASSSPLSTHGSRSLYVYFTAKNEYNHCCGSTPFWNQSRSVDSDRDLKLLLWCRSDFGSGASILMWIWIWIWRFYFDIDSDLGLALLFWCRSVSGSGASTLMLIRIWIWHFCFDADPISFYVDPDPDPTQKQGQYMPKFINLNCS